MATVNLTSLLFVLLQQNSTFSSSSRASCGVDFYQLLSNLVLLYALEKHRRGEKLPQKITVVPEVKMHIEI